MKTKIAFICICLLSTHIIIQAPPRTFKGARAAKSEASTSQAQHVQPTESVSLTSPLEPLGADSQQETNILPVPIIQISHQDDQDLEIYSDNSSSDDEPSNSLPIDPHRSSVAFAVLTSLTTTTQPTKREIQELHSLTKLQENSVEQDDESQASSSQQIPQQSWIQFIKETSSSVWEQNITDKNRLERFARKLGIKTYNILYQKQQNHELAAFINSLNVGNSREGNRWFEDAIQEAMADKREDVLRAIIIPQLSPALILPATTLSEVTRYLNNCVEELQRTLESLQKKDCEVEAYIDDNDYDSINK